MSNPTQYFFLSSSSAGDEALGPLSIEQAVSAVYEEYGRQVWGGETRILDGTESDLDAGRPVRCQNIGMESRAVAFGDDHPPTVAQLMEWLGVEAEAARDLLRRCGIYSNEEFKLHIAMGNAAMSKPVHVAASLRSVAQQIEDHARLYTDRETQIRDSNGNQVGGYRLRPQMRPDRRVRAHELNEGDRVLVLDGRGERTPETIKSITRDGRTFDVVYESGRTSVFGQNDYAYTTD